MRFHRPGGRVSHTEYVWRTLVREIQELEFELHGEETPDDAFDGMSEVQLERCLEEAEAELANRLEEEE